MKLEETNKPKPSITRELVGRIAGLVNNNKNLSDEYIEATVIDLMVEESGDNAIALMGKVISANNKRKAKELNDLSVGLMQSAMEEGMRRSKSISIYGYDKAFIHLYPDGMPRESATALNKFYEKYIDALMVAYNNDELDEWSMKHHGRYESWMGAINYRKKQD